MLDIVLATHNAHKVEEFQALFDTSSLDVRVHRTTGEAPRETGVTFADNALIKARAAAELEGRIALADDSGLAVDVLGGAPGVFSARWAGRLASDETNRELLLEQLADVPPEHRAASFHCALALVVPPAFDPEGLGGELVVEGVWPGAIAFEAAGEFGFGYDPIFIPDGFAIAAAELKPEIKNVHSHRARAFAELAAAMAEIFGGTSDAGSV
ncbi:MAG TPA: RdgB/HAM1 family non-canonical purine NTP pyrophosphatase [Microbacteriaceae bacterium]|nr:RdgB/HAM1 family non-canonical purine NTP pyrophosphatase [Microbacteriaceae bacterium]